MQVTNERGYRVPIIHGTSHPHHPLRPASSTQRSILAKRCLGRNCRSSAEPGQLGSVLACRLESSRPMSGELHELRNGPAHRFSDFATVASTLPRTGAGVYTIWDDAGGLVYVGIAGRNPSGSGLASRLRSHASGRRSGDQFCMYVADHYVMPELTHADIEAIRTGALSMDARIRDCIHGRFAFRFIAAASYADAMAIENRVKQGALGEPPRLNPTSPR
jgi:hypothetical protein